MNTIIIHHNNRPRVPMEVHKFNAALISPVPIWYRKPTPWWVDGVEEKGLRPIAEVEEKVEEELYYVRFEEGSAQVEKETEPEAKEVDPELVEVFITIAANIEFEDDEAAIKKKVDDDEEEWSIIEVDEAAAEEKVDDDDEEWSIIGDEEAAVGEKVENDEEEWSIIEDVSLAGEDYVFVDVSLDDDNDIPPGPIVSFEVVNGGEESAWDEKRAVTVAVVEVDVDAEDDGGEVWYDY